MLLFLSVVGFYCPYVPTPRKIDFNASEIWPMQRKGLRNIANPFVMQVFAVS